MGFETRHDDAQLDPELIIALAPDASEIFLSATCRKLHGERIE
jgi:hypothetical protein